jgi:8-oxo-dGTP pyrophosphatase MutT (NUDIX family)
VPRHINNAVLIAYHQASGRILVQDRRGHRPPPWGFFGGGIEQGETPLQAVLREVREELGMSLSENEVSDQGVLTGSGRDLTFRLHPFSWAFDGDLTVFTLGEGSGMELVTPDEMLGRVETGGPDDHIARFARTFLERIRAERPL